jgi:protein involved in polysaccharide export with SLBB domain
MNGRRTTSLIAAAAALGGTLFAAPRLSWAQVPTPLNGGNGGTSAPVTPEIPTATPPPAEALVPDYRLDTGDVVAVYVERHGDVNRNVPLMADATVMLPRMEKPISARGLTCTELAEQIRVGLSHPRAFILKPGQVTVQLVTARMRRVYVRGNVVRGTEYDLKNDWRITELVASMGGVPQPNRVTAILTNGKRPAPVKIDLTAALADESGSANIALMEGDTLTVNGPETKVFFVKGEGPRGKHDIDERFTLKQALVQLGVTANGATGELRKAKLIRHETPGDPTSPTTDIPVDLISVLSDDGTDSKLQDYDTLEIPVSLRFYYVWGEVGGPRKRLLPEDRKTYLLDVMSDSGGTTGSAKIGNVTVWREVSPGIRDDMHYDYGRYLRNGDPKHNPEILAGDIVFVPNVKRVDPISTIWTGFGLYNLVKTFVPGLP